MKSFENYLKSRFLSKISPLYGPFDFGRLPYLQAIAQAVDAADNEITIAAANSTGKTLLSSFFVEWASLFVPGNMLIYAQGDDEAKSNWINDYEQFFKNDSLMKKISRRVVQGSVEFVTGEYVKCLGANPGNANGFQVTKVAGTEIHLWPDGILAAVKKRTGGAGRFDRIILLDSTRGRAESDLERQVMASSGGRWHVRCLKCSSLFPLNLLDEKDLSRFSGVIRFDVGAGPGAWMAPDGVEIVCPSCGEAHADERGYRREISAAGEYIFERPGLENQSFSWSALSASWNPAHAEISAYYEAMDALKVGNEEVMRDFIKKREAFPDTGEMPSASTFAPVFSATFEGARMRTLTIDLQGAGGIHFWALVCDFSSAGKCHVLDFQRLDTWEQCRVIQVRWGVRWNSVAVDVKWASLRHEALARCALWGWFALSAFPQESFTHKDGKSKAWTNTIKSQAGARSPSVMRARMEARKTGFDKICDLGLTTSNRSPLFAHELRWSKPFFRGLFLFLRDSALFSLCKSLKLIDLLQKQLATSAEGKDHAADCLQMALVLAIRRGVDFSATNAKIVLDKYRVGS